MPPNLPAPPVTANYHQRVQWEKRAALLEAAISLFLSEGYNGTSLAKVASAAGVSTATLFKHFPTKADLFEAIVTEYWTIESQEAAMPEPGDPRKGLNNDRTRLRGTANTPANGLAVPPRDCRSTELS